VLALAEGKLAGDKGLAPRVRLVRGDLRAARLGQRFNLAIVALDTFGLVVEQAVQRRVLASLRRHLLPSGLLALDVANGNLRGGEAPDETVLHRACPMGRAEAWVAKWVVRRTDHAAQVDRLIHLYDESSPDGAVRRTAVEIELRYFTRFELELLLERAGF